MFFLPLRLGQPGIDPQVLLPSTEKFKTPGRSAIKGVLVNTPTLTWAYTRTLKEKGRRDP
jgi:hypothetical protein